MINLCLLPDECFVAVALAIRSDRQVAKLLGMSKNLHTRFAGEFRRRRQRALMDAFSNLRAREDDEFYTTDSWKTSDAEISFRQYVKDCTCTVRVVLRTDYLCVHERTRWQNTDGWGIKYTNDATNIIHVYPHSGTTWANYDMPESDDDTTDPGACERPFVDHYSADPVFRMILGPKDLAAAPPAESQ